MIAWFQGWMIARLNDYMMTWLYDGYTQYRLSQKWLPHPSTPWLHEYMLAWWIVEYHMNLPHDARGVGDPQCHHLRLICLVHLLLPHDEFTSFTITKICPMMQGESVILNATIYDSFARSIFYYPMMNLHYLISHESAPWCKGSRDPQCHHLRLLFLVHLLLLHDAWLDVCMMNSIEFHTNLAHDAGWVGDSQRHHLRLLCPVHLLLPQPQHRCREFNLCQVHNQLN